MPSNHPTAQASASEPGLFQCGSCHRKYKRLDHLARHVRSHTQAKPFQCRVCGKYFARSDILKRHLAGHDSQQLRPERAPGTPPTDPQDAPGRVSRACRSCASNHLRCTEQKPCRRCVDRGAECMWEESPQMVLSPPGTVASGSMEGSMEGFPRTDVSLRSPTVSEARGKTPPPIDLDGMTQSAMDTDMVEPHGPFPDWTFVPGQWTPMGAAPFEFAPNMELEDIDLRFLDAYNVNIPFELTGAAPPAPLPQADTIPSRSPPADPCSAAALATEAFRDSHWRFRPNAQDHGAAEEHNLSLPSGHASPETRVRLDRRATGTRLGVPARDKILTTVIESCRPENTARAVAAFPSVELLDSLLQYSLTSPVSRFDSFLHAATFNPNEKRPELIAAMASRGAVLTADAALTKLGFAIQECLRTAVPKQWERHNHLIRDLELAQSFQMTLEIGLWSGHGRKVEIAESFLQPGLTMLRRGGKFRRASYPPITLRGDETGEELEERWRAWVKQESFKRLVFRVLQHDADSSTALLVNPLISYAEVQLPLPAPEGLWSAGTAEEWKVGFLALEAQTLTVADFIDEPEKLQTHRGLVDAAAASLAFLSCTWSLAWEIVQLGALQRSRPRRWNAMLTTSRREELLKLLGRFRIAMDPYAPCAQDLIMRLELTLLHLHMPFEEIQLFAGMEGPEQARVVYPSVLEWARSEAARSAIWHAGQVLRVARALPRAMLQEHAATTVYHAGLALWVYGLVFESAAPDGVISSADPSSAHDICLDEADSLLLQRFIQFGSGHPCIRGMPETESQYGEPLNVVHLRHPDMVVETVVGILAASHDGMARPRLVEQLMQLMTGLQRASKRAMES